MLPKYDLQELIIKELKSSKKNGEGKTGTENAIKCR